MNQIMMAISASAIWTKAWPVVIAILFFGLIIASHELGHFTFAKLFKIKVNEFAIGMGPAIFKITKGETKYSLRLFPIGGFCSMEGEDKDSDNERAFCNAKPWKKLIVVLAGGIINIILGIVIIAIMNANSDMVGSRYIHSFYESATSCNTGLQVYDEILEINGRHVFSDYDMSFLMSRDEDGIIDFVVRRKGEITEVKNVEFVTSTTEANGKTYNIITNDFIIVGLKPTFMNVVKSSFRETASFARMVWLSLFDLCTGKYGISDVSGPIGTVDFVAEAASEAKQETDYGYLLSIMALITINLGVFNLIPFPALDGGRAFFIFVEMIIRRPVPKKYEGWVHAIGMILLLGFMAIITFSDILKLVKG